MKPSSCQLPVHMSKSVSSCSVDTLSTCTVIPSLLLYISPCFIATCGCCQQTSCYRLFLQVIWSASMLNRKSRRPEFKLFWKSSGFTAFKHWLLRRLCNAIAWSQSTYALANAQVVRCQGIQIPLWSCAQQRNSQWTSKMSKSPLDERSNSCSCETWLTIS